MARKQTTAPDAAPNRKAKIEIRIRVDEDMAARIQKAADDDGNSAAAFVRFAVNRELKRREKEDAE